MNILKRLLNLSKKDSVQEPSAQQAEKDVVCPVPKDSTQQTEKDVISSSQKDSTQQTEKDVVCPESKVYNCADVYVLLVASVSKISAGPCCSPRQVNFYLVGTKIEDKYYELFSGVELKTSPSDFNTPFIKEIEPLKEYLTDPELSEIDGQLLFGFLVELNTDTIMSMLIDKEDEDEDEDENEYEDEDEDE